MDATVITALFLAAIGAVVLAYILRALFIAFVGTEPRGLTDKLALKRKESSLTNADLLIKAGSVQEAAVLLQKSFLFDHIKSSDALIDASVNLHLGILSRVIMICDRKGMHLENLAVVEDLIQSRGQLLHSFIETQREKGALKQKRNESGKGVASWALSEFDKKLDEIEDRIKTNRRSLESQVATLFSAIGKIADSSQVTYH